MSSRETGEIRDVEAESDRVSADSKKPKRHHLAIWILLLLLGCQHTAIRMMNLPLNRVIELRYCRQYYLNHDPSMIDPDGSVQESRCKLDIVQQELAWMHGSLDILHATCDILVTIPLGILSDRGHRRLVLCLNLCGLSAMYLWILLVGYHRDIFPVKAMLFGPLFSLFGGADCVFLSSTAAIVTEIAPDEAQRASYFAYISSIVYVTGLISPSIAAFTMTINLWLPFLIGIAILLFAIPLLLCLPTNRTKPVVALEDSEPLLRRGSQDTKLSPTASSLSALYQRGTSACTIVWYRATRRRNFRLLMGVFLFASLASSNTPIFPQYISKRYGWTFAEAGYLLSVKAAVNIVLLTVVVPMTVTLLHHKSGITGVAINTYGAKASLIISVLGAFLIAVALKIWMLATAFIVYAGGSALTVFTMSLVKSPVISGQDEDAAQDYSIVMISRTLGALTGLPIMTVAWAKCISIGGAALGMPYFISALAYCISYILLQKLRVQ